MYNLCLPPIWGIQQAFTVPFKKTLVVTLLRFTRLHHGNVRLAGVISNMRMDEDCSSTALNILLPFILLFLTIYANFAVGQNIVLNARQQRNAP